MAPGIASWRFPATPFTSTGRATRCSQAAPSPISRKTISTTTARWRSISASNSLSPSRSRPHRRVRRMWSARTAKTVRECSTPAAASLRSASSRSRCASRALIWRSFGSLATTTSRTSSSPPNLRSPLASPAKRYSAPFPLSGRAGDGLRKCSAAHLLPMSMSISPTPQTGSKRC